MPPFLALLLWFVLLIALLYWDPARDAKISVGLWVPVLWIFILGSRLPAQWLGGQASGVQALAFEEGNPLDRAFFFVLILFAIVILMSRSFNWGDFFVRNIALLAFVSFALVSVVWSDFPLVAFKRWFRDLGNYLVILVVLSDPRPVEAVCMLLRRLAYLLLPLSVLLIKYFPDLAKQYDSWTGASTYAGASTSKNMLGAMCLISGLFFFWDTLMRWSNRKERRVKHIIMLNIALIAMALWLLNLSNSATSRICLVIGCIVIVAARSHWGKRHPGFLKVIIPASFCVYLIVAFGFGLNGSLAGAVGRNPTLTDRTIIWNVVLNMHTNPIVGTGYESFWLGPRLDQVWRTVPGINEAHNGYLETYLNLGLIGVFLIAGLLISGYRNVCKKNEAFSGIAVLYMAFWTITLFYNMTEAAFKSGLIWIVFLLATISLPKRSVDLAQSAATFKNADPKKGSLSPPLAVASQRR